MVLIANKPCSFGGQKFYIGDKIPANLVADARLQEKLGVLTVTSDIKMAGEGQPGTFYTQEQVDKMLEEAINEAVNNTVMEMEQKQDVLQAAEEQQELYAGTVLVGVGGKVSGDNGQVTVIPATPEEIQQVFSIMQMNAEDGSKEIAGVTSENVLVLLHAADSRKTIKNAAKEQAGKLQHTDVTDTDVPDTDADTGCNNIAGSNTGEDSA